jgi:VWFA-related protein
MGRLKRVGQRKFGAPVRILVAALSLASAIAPATPANRGTEPKEVSATDVQPTYTLQSQRNLVTIRAVVRDASGRVVETLHKEDFEIRDRGKRQEIANFSLEKPGQPPGTVQVSGLGEGVTTAPGEVPAPVMASRFVALVFDDVNTPFEDLKRTKDAAKHYLDTSVRPGDRVALFTASGRQPPVDFTSDLALIERGLAQIVPRPLSPKATACDQFPIPPYEAYLIAEQNDSGAISVAVQQIVQCECPSPNSPGSAACLQGAELKVDSEARQALAFDQMQVEPVLRAIEAVVRSIGALPGQRSVIVISSGFLTVSPGYGYELDRIAERALRAGVTVNGLDARGLYGDVVADASRGGPGISLAVLSSELSYLREGIRRQSEAMRNLAHDTGGIFFENSNDYDAGFRKVAGIPEAYYLLTFSPQNLKHDGLYHTISVTLPELKGMKVQARPGYFAPPKSEDAASQAKDEIRDALYSTEESQTVPIDVHTQFFKASAQKASIAVFTHVDLHPLRFSKQGDRNVDQLTFVTALFDIDGKAVSIQQKVLDFQMHDATLAKFMQTGVTLRGNFDVAPGTYKVREVVRESQSGQVSTLNRTVEIPY